MERDQARYHAMSLRAVCNLLADGEPVCWSWSYGTSDEDPTTLSISIASGNLRAAEIVVHQRVEASDESYVIQVEPRPAGETPGFRRRRR